MALLSVPTSHQTVLLLHFTGGCIASERVGVDRESSVGTICNWEGGIEVRLSVAVRFTLCHPQVHLMEIITSLVN